MRCIDFCCLGNSCPDRGGPPEDLPFIKSRWSLHQDSIKRLSVVEALDWSVFQYRQFSVAAYRRSATALFEYWGEHLEAMALWKIYRTLGLCNDFLLSYQSMPPYSYSQYGCSYARHALIIYSNSGCDNLLYHTKSMPLIQDIFALRSMSRHLLVLTASSSAVVFLKLIKLKSRRWMRMKTIWALKDLLSLLAILVAQRTSLCKKRSIGA